MAPTAYQIRECNHCGLRYPVVVTQTPNTRCPACLGLTKIISNNKVLGESNRIDRQKLRDQRKPFVGVLDNIRSALNVGAIFRTADGLGLNHLYLCGITPTPKIPEVRKTGLGAQDAIPWSYHQNGVKLVKSIKTEGSKLIVLENKKEALSIEEIEHSDLIPADQVALVVGNEITGVDPAVIDMADVCIKIPMFGQKSSFNVSNAFAIAAYVVSSKFEEIID